MKQTKKVKFVFAVLLIVPMVLFTIAIVQTFVVKSKKGYLTDAQTTLSERQEVYDENSEIYNYMNSEEYWEEYYKHHPQNGENYGNEGDINIEINSNNRQ